VDEKIASLGETPRPHNVEKLRDKAGDVFRVRTGDWRIIYIVDDGNRRVLVSRVKRRNERTYRGL
jgi:mRNA interferase RelE/StbE